MKCSRFVTVSFVAIVSSMAALGSTCDDSQMKDPCPIDGYSIVNIEKATEVSHNQMHDIHHLHDFEKTKRHKRHTYKRHYLYTLSCRWSRVK